MDQRQLEVGDIVQIRPDRENDFFGGCLMVVTEPKSFGAQGFVSIPGERGTMPGRAYARVKFEDMEYVGKATWVPEDGVTEPAPPSST